MPDSASQARGVWGESVVGRAVLVTQGLRCWRDRTSGAG